MYIAGSLVLIPLLLMVYYVFGKQFAKHFKISLTAMEQLLVGFFVYFSVFQIIVLPLTVLKMPLSVLTGVWSMLLAAVLFYEVRERIKNRNDEKRVRSFGDVRCSFGLEKRTTAMVALLFFLLLGIQWLYTLQAGYQGFDTAYYVGNVNTSVYTNSMYMYDPNTGAKLTSMPLRYLLSSYYMHNAVICQLTGLPAVTFMRVCAGLICSILSYLLIWMLGKLAMGIHFRSEYGWWLMFFAAVINWNSHTLHSTATFLLERSYEAKALCAVVVIPAVLWAMMRLLKDPEKENWKLAGLMGFANVAVSMSGILIVPILMTACIGAHILVRRRWKDIGKYVLCMLPNGLYLFVYLLGTMGIIVLWI